MKKILIVDDEPSYRDSLELILSHEDYQVRTAADGPAALESGDGFGPDVLIADWMLRGSMNGLEVAKTLLESNPDMRTIVITGYSTPRLESQAGEIEGTEVLTKPFGVDQLLDAVERALN
jgi:DNA-binding NtrC family response regulator